MPKYPEKSDKLFSAPLMRRGIFIYYSLTFYMYFLLLFPLFFLTGLLGYTCHNPILFLWHAMLCFLFCFIPIAYHVNILFPCPVCVSGYRIIWHAMIL